MIRAQNIKKLTLIFLVAVFFIAGFFVGQKVINPPTPQIAQAATKPKRIYYINFFNAVHSYLLSVRLTPHKVNDQLIPKLVADGYFSRQMPYSNNRIDYLVNLPNSTEEYGRYVNGILRRYLVDWEIKNGYTVYYPNVDNNGNHIVLDLAKRAVVAGLKITLPPSIQDSLGLKGEDIIRTYAFNRAPSMVQEKNRIMSVMFDTQNISTPSGGAPNGPGNGAYYLRRKSELTQKALDRIYATEIMSKYIVWKRDTNENFWGGWHQEEYWALLFVIGLDPEIANYMTTHPGTTFIEAENRSVSAYIKSTVDIAATAGIVIPSIKGGKALIGAIGIPKATANNTAKRFILSGIPTNYIMRGEASKLRGRALSQVRRNIDDIITKLESISGRKFPPDTIIKINRNLIQLDEMGRMTNIKPVGAFLPSLRMVIFNEKGVIKGKTSAIFHELIHAINPELCGEPILGKEKSFIVENMTEYYTKIIMKRFGYTYLKEDIALYPDYLISDLEIRLAKRQGISIVAAREKLMKVIFTSNIDNFPKNIDNLLGKGFYSHFEVIFKNYTEYAIIVGGITGEVPLPEVIPRIAQMYQWTNNEILTWGFAP